MARRRPPTAGIEEASRVTRERLAAIEKVAAKFKGWRPRAEVIRNVEAVPTIFPQYDDATGVGGHPISRFTLIHGPNNEGKTEFSLGVGLSFLRGGHFFGLADAERTTTDKWVRSLMGSLADHPGFRALPITTYEQVRDSVRHFCETIAASRLKGELPPDTSGLIVVDSIRKLVPKKLWDELAKAQSADKAEKKGKQRGAPKGHVDGYGGRAGQLKAGLNAAWVDELIPLLADTRIGMIVIARETEDPNADPWEDPDRVKVGGGAALLYEASLRIRITRGWVKGSDDRIIGERHKLEIRKTKIAGKQTKIPTAFFHTSNGVASPVGFEPARDLIEIGLDFDVIELAGSWIKFEGKSLGQGVDHAVAALNADPKLFAEIDRRVREKSAKERA